MGDRGLADGQDRVDFHLGGSHRSLRAAADVAGRCAEKEAIVAGLRFPGRCFLPGHLADVLYRDFGRDPAAVVEGIADLVQQFAFLAGEFEIGACVQYLVKMISSAFLSAEFFLSCAQKRRFYW